MPLKFTLGMEIKDRIKQLMESMNMSQKDFARLLNMSSGSLSNIFLGRNRPTNNHTMAIHKAFPNVNINWLLFGEGQMYDQRPSSSAGNAPSLFEEGDNVTGGEVDEMASGLQQTPTNLQQVASGSQQTSSSFPPVSTSSLAAGTGTDRPLPFTLSAAPQRVRTSTPRPAKVEYVRRQVKEIRVFYDDGTYESFVPSEKG